MACRFGDEYLLSAATVLLELFMRTKKSSHKSAFSKSVKGKTAHVSRSVRPAQKPSKTPKAPEPAENILPEVETGFAELENGALIEAIEDPSDPSRTLFATYKHGRVQLAARAKDRGRILVPTPATRIGFYGVKLPNGVTRYKSVKHLLLTLFTFIRCGIDVPVEYAIVLSAFVLYTWVADRLPNAVYLSVIGLPQSGKSTLLELLTCLCRRGLLTNDISQAAAYQACSDLNPTLLIDEIDWNSSRSARDFRQLLRAGSNSSSRSLRVRHSGSSFGPKVFGSLEASSDPALNSRCIQLVMAETKKTELLRPGHPSMTKIAANLRRQLLKFRLRSYKSIRPAVVPGAEALRPRSRDLLHSLAAPVENQRWTKILLGFMELTHDPVTREGLDPRHEALIAAVWEDVHREPSLSYVRFGGDSGLRAKSNEILKQSGERIEVTDKAVGRMLASLGFRRTERTKIGWILRFDSTTLDRCHELVKTHGNKHIQDSEYANRAAKCAICKMYAATAEAK